MNSIQKKELILNGYMPKVILTLALPIMVNNFIQTIYNLTDTFFVAKLGDYTIAAIQFTWPLVFFMMSFGIGMSIAGTSLISQYIGADDNHDAKVVAGQIISFSFIFSVAFGLFGYFASGFLLKLMQAPDTIYANAHAYIKIMFLGMPTMFMMFAFNSIKQGQGDTVSPMIITGISVVMNIILDPIFIFTLGLGIEGAAIATVLSRGIFAAYAISTLFTKFNGIKLELHDLKIQKDVMYKMLKIGLPSSIGQSTTSVGFAVLNGFVVSFGSATLSSFAIGNRISSLILMPAMGIGNALAPVIGQNLGADNIERAKNAVKTSNILSTIFLVVGGSILLFFSENIVRIFSDNPAIIKQGTFYLRLITASLPLMGYFQVFIGTFQGSGHTLSAMVMMMGRLWLFRIPLIVIFKTFTNLGANSVWFAMILSNFLICLVGLIIYKTGKWQHKIIKKKKYA